MGLTSINVNNIDTNLRPNPGVTDHAITVANSAVGLPMTTLQTAVANGTSRTFAKWSVSGPGTFVNALLLLDSAGTTPVSVTSKDFGLVPGKKISLIVDIQSAFGTGDSYPTGALYNGGVKIGDITLTDGGPSVKTIFQFVPSESEIELRFNYGGGDGDDELFFTSVQASTPLADETTHVFWTLDTADARFTLDGSAPTTTNGHLADGTNGVKSGIWHRGMAEAAKWIRTGDTSAVLHVSELTQ